MQMNVDIDYRSILRLSLLSLAPKLQPAAWASVFRWNYFPDYLFLSYFCAVEIRNSSLISISIFVRFFQYDVNVSARVFDG